MLYAYLSGLHIKPMYRRGSFAAEGVSPTSGKFIGYPLSRRMAEKKLIQLRVVDNNDADLASIHIIPALANAAIAITVPGRPRLILFACLKTIYRFAKDHKLTQITINSTMDLARAFPALELSRDQSLSPGCYVMNLSDIARRFEKNPHNSFLVYLIEMPHLNIRYK
jgi:hypothetical protein